MAESADPNEEFAGNPAINADIHEMLAKFPESSRSRMRRKIRKARDAAVKTGSEEADAQARHIFREFVVATRLNANGLHLEYEKKLGGRTPDWYDEESRLLLEVFTCERGGRANPVKRIAERITEKVADYRQLVEDHNLYYLVAVYGDFMTGLDADDCKEAIESGDLFNQHPALSGVVFFSESTVIGGKQQYRFTFFGSEAASRKIDLTPCLADRRL